MSMTSKPTDAPPEQLPHQIAAQIVRGHTSLTGAKRQALEDAIEQALLASASSAPAGQGHESHVFNPRCRECLLLALGDAAYVAERDGKASLSPDTFRVLLNIVRRPAPDKGAVRRAAERIFMFTTEIDVDQIVSIIEGELGGSQ